jgi:flagella basal body P-ring formation protein FlgA
VGSQVRVVASGSGFELSATGQAASAGYVGQSARVKLGNGKIVSGVVTRDGTVSVGI